MAGVAGGGVGDLCSRSVRCRSSSGAMWRLDQKVSFEWKKYVQNVNYVIIILSDVLSGDRHQRHPEMSAELTSD